VGRAALVSVFGSYNAALEAAGLRPLKRSYTREELIEQLQRKKESLGRLPLTDDVIGDPDMASMKLFYDAFGSFNAAREAAGFGSRGRLVKYTPETLINQLQQKAAQIGRAPYAREVHSDPNMATIATFTRFFGSYSKAVQEAGFTPGAGTPKKNLLADTVAKHEKSTTNDASDFLTQLLNMSKRLGRIPTTREIKADPDMPSPNKIKAALRTSSWAEVVGHIKPFL
jgi:hypothetical protein